MKFGYDTDGKLVPIEQLELAEAIADLDVKLNASAPKSRTTSAKDLRELLECAGETLTAEDENVFALYTEGALDFGNVEDYFGARLQRAVLRKFGEGESAA